MRREFTPPELARFRYLNAAIPRLALPYYFPDETGLRWERESPVSDNVFDSLCFELTILELTRGKRPSTSPLNCPGWGSKGFKLWLDANPGVNLPPFDIESIRITL